MISGTSGYYYKYWGPQERYEKCGISNFYKSNKKSLWLTEYSKVLNSVEINCTRYKKLTPKMCSTWVKQVPSNFKFVIKASTYITHQKKLNDFDVWWNEFEKCIEALGDYFECILFQFHESFKKNKKNMDKLGIVKKIIPKNIKCAFEFRNIDWYNEQEDIFTGSWTLSIIHVPKDSKGFGTLKSGFNIGITNKDFVYIRCHGTNTYSKGTYTTEDIDMLKDMTNNICKEGRKMIFFNNVDTWTLEPFEKMEGIYGSGFIPLKVELTPSAIYNASMFK